MELTEMQKYFASLLRGCGCSPIAVVTIMSLVNAPETMTALAHRIAAKADSGAEVNEQMILRVFTDFLKELDLGEIDT